jgi:hypothetical protein
MREKMLPSQTLPDFQQYLLSRKLVPGKSVTAGLAELMPKTGTFTNTNYW